MTFSSFSIYLQRLEGIPSRIQMTEVLAQLFKELDKEEIKPAMYLLQGRLMPQYDSLEFGLSEKMLLRVLTRGDATALDESEIRKRYKQLGDIGLLAEQVFSESSKSQIEIQEVYDRLLEVANSGGEGSQEKKIVLLSQLLHDLDAISAKFVVRMVIGKMRLGFSTMTILDALSWAVYQNKSDSSKLEDSLNKRADVGSLATVYLSANDDLSRLNALNKYDVMVGTPVIPALCQRLESAQEVVEKMGMVFVEPKYDGMRLQIHIWKESSELKIKAFTRNLEDVSPMFPELQKFAKTLNCSACILDAEAIGFNPVTKKLLPFQQTITRRRKHEVSQKAEEIPIKFFVFDILSLDNLSLIDKPLRERKIVLEKLIHDNEYASATQAVITDQPEVIQKYHHQQLAEGLEGVVIKQAISHYESGRKGWNWVKMKEEEGNRGKLTDTIDVVVMGYFYGRGKRAVLGMGAFLVGVLNKEDELVTIAKIGTGISDEQLTQLAHYCEQIKEAVQPKNYLVSKALQPDVWTQPKLVLEVAADEVTTSPTHTAGVALRFPRLVTVRQDKGWQQITTLKEVKDIGQLK